MIEDVAAINISNDTKVRTLVKQIKTDFKDKQTNDGAVAGAGALAGAGAEKTADPTETDDPNISVTSQSQSLFSQMSQPQLENTLTETEEDMWSRME